MEKTNNRSINTDYGLDLFDFIFIMKKRIVVIVLITLGCSLVAAGYALTTPKTYKISNMLVVHQTGDGDLLSQSDIIALISFLDKLRHKNTSVEDDILMLLGLSRKEFKEIRKISIIESKGSSALWIDIDTHNVQYGIKLMEALPKYLLSNPSISNKLRLKKEMMLKNSQDLKEVISSPQKELQTLNDSAIFYSIVDLYTLREKYNFLITLLREIDSGQIVTLSWKTVGPETPFKPVVSSCIVIGMITGMLLGVIIAFAVESVSNYRGNNRLKHTEK